MITIRQATEEERVYIMRESFVFSGSIPLEHCLTTEQVYDLCGIDWRKMREEEERENEFWRRLAFESLRRILVRDGGL